MPEVASLHSRTDLSSLGYQNKSKKKHYGNSPMYFGGSCLICHWHVTIGYFATNTIQSITSQLKQETSYGGKAMLVLSIFKESGITCGYVLNPN
jgi:hypothetical protein